MINIAATVHMSSATAIALRLLPTRTIGDAAVAARAMLTNPPVLVVRAHDQSVWFWPLDADLVREMRRERAA